MDTPDEPRPLPPKTSPTSWWWGTALAWLVIVAMCLITALLPRLSRSPEGPQDEDVIGVTLMQLQARYAVGLADLFPLNGRDIYQSMQPILNAGTVGQRQRSIIVAAHLAGVAEARERLEGLDMLLADPPEDEPIELSESQASIQRILHRLYPASIIDLEEGEEAHVAAEAVRSLSGAERSVLQDEFGWFGALALAPSAPEDTAAREAALGPARVVALVIVAVAIGGVMAGTAGFVGLTLLVVFTLTGRLTSGLGSRRGYHGIYAETFAVWLVLFLGLQVLAGLVATPRTEMLVVVFMSLASLSALGWPVLRGVPWSAVRQDVGLTLGRVPWAEPFLGLVGYLVTLPLLAAGVILMLGLMRLQGFLLGDPPTFGPTGGPAHPIIVHLLGSDVWPKVQLLVLASVAAPIVEETMFRGVLYRHLRDASARLGLVWSVLVSAAVSGFLFASVHPQGIVAIPALMALAIGMALIREWRGTLVPSMVIHGVSNGLIMSLLLIVLGV